MPVKDVVLSKGLGRMWPWWRPLILDRRVDEMSDSSVVSL